MREPIYADAVQFTAANSALHVGQWGVERDTGKYKIGDGHTKWNALPYVDTDGTQGGGAAGTIDGGTP